jgi:hypothetical protein
VLVDRIAGRRRRRSRVLRGRGWLALQQGRWRAAAAQREGRAGEKGQPWHGGGRAQPGHSGAATRGNVSPHEVSPAARRPPRRAEQSPRHRARRHTGKGRFLNPTHGSTKQKRTTRLNAPPPLPPRTHTPDGACSPRRRLGSRCARQSCSSSPLSCPTAGRKDDEKGMGGWGGRPAWAAAVAGGERAKGKRGLRRRPALRRLQRTGCSEGQRAANAAAPQCAAHHLHRPLHVH